MKPLNYIRGITTMLIMGMLSLGNLLQAQELRLAPGIRLVANGAPYIVLNDLGLINNGQLIPGAGTVVFAGSADANGSTIGGSRELKFHHLTINIPSRQVQLLNHITVAGRLTLNKGNLELNKYTLDLGTTGTIEKERNEARITGAHGGRVKIAALLNTPQAVNPGNIGVEIADPANLGITVITRGHTQQITADGTTGIERYFEVAPATKTPARSTLRFHYLDAELGHGDENELTLFASGSGRNNWLVLGKDRSDLSSNWITRTQVDPAQRFTLAAAAVKHGGIKTAVSAQVFPNPFRDKFTITFFSDQSKEVVVNFYDQLGYLLERRKVPCRAGVNYISWNTGLYTAGMYHLTFEQLNVKKMTIIKQ